MDFKGMCRVVYECRTVCAHVRAIMTLAGQTCTRTLRQLYSEYLTVPM